MKSNVAELTTIVDYAVLDTRLDSRRQEVPAPIRLTEHYSLRGEVGAGGVGRVLLGFDERISREVAIKEMHADAESMDPRIHARFLREEGRGGRGLEVALAHPENRAGLPGQAAGIPAPRRFG